MIKVFYWHKDMAIYLHIENWIRKNNIERYNYSRKLLRKEDRLSSMAVGVLLSMMTNERRVEIIRKKNGKPFLKNNFVSITHSNNYVGCAVSDQDVGIDIEDENNVTQMVISSVCNEQEQKIIEKYGLAGRFWTVKEAESKLLNEDLYSLPKTNIRFSQNKLIDTNRKEVSLVSLNLSENDNLCIASNQKDDFLTVKEVFNKDIINWIISN